MANKIRQQDNGEGILDRSNRPSECHQYLTAISMFQYHDPTVVSSQLGLSRPVMLKQDSEFASKLNDRNII